MNYERRSRFGGIAAVLLVPMILIGCTEDACIELVAVVCTPLMDNPLSFGLCILAGATFCVFTTSAGITECSEAPDKCTATFEQMQLAAIEFCEEYPAECQEAFDSWAESLDTEDTE